MNDIGTMLIVVVAFGLGYFIISKLIDFGRKFWSNQPVVESVAGSGEKEFLFHVCSLARKLATADAPLNQQEFTVINAYIFESTKTDETLRVKLVELVNATAKSINSFEYHAGECYRIKSGDAAALSVVMQFLQSVAVSDGPINALEQTLLNSAREVFKLA